MAGGGGRAEARGGAVISVLGESCGFGATWAKFDNKSRLALDEGLLAWMSMMRRADKSLEIMVMSSIFAVSSQRYSSIATGEVGFATMNFSPTCSFWTSPGTFA